MITVRDVSKVYGKKESVFKALENVSFDIPDGKTVAIIGKSGSGKSTLMHILGGLDTASSGSVLVNGQQLDQLKAKAMDRFRAKDLGFVFQSFFVEANQTCFQNVSLPLEINDVPLRSRRGLVQKALEQVELSDKIDQNAGNLSGGQKQRLAIARAIVNRPKLILADEPTGNLDSATGDIVVSLLFRLHRELGTGLVIVTHDEELAAQCDISIVMKDGKVVEVRQRPAESRSSGKQFAVKPPQGAVRSGGKIL